MTKKGKIQYYYFVLYSQTKNKHEQRNLLKHNITRHTQYKRSKFTVPTSKYISGTVVSILKHNKRKKIAIANAALRYWTFKSSLSFLGF